MISPYQCASRVGSVSADHASSIRCPVDPPPGRYPYRPLLAGGPECACLQSSATSSFVFAPGDLAVQGIKPLLPQDPVRTQPFIEFGERLGIDAVDPPLCLLAHLHQPGLAQNPQVTRHSGASNGQECRQLADGTLVGNVDVDQQEWLWSWADRSVPPEVVGDMEQVRRYGHEHAFPLLTWPRFRADSMPVTYAHAMAAEVLAAEGIWRDWTAGVKTYFLLHEMRRVRSVS